MFAETKTAPNVPCRRGQSKLPLALVVGIFAGFAALIGFFVGLNGG